MVDTARNILTILTNPKLSQQQRILLSYLNAHEKDEITTNYTIVGEDILMTEQTASRTISQLVQAGYMQKKTISKVGIKLSDFRP